MGEELEESIYRKYLIKYTRSLGRQLVFKMLDEKKIEPYQSIIKHLEYALLAVDTDRSFGREDFDFTEFYE